MKPYTMASLIALALLALPAPAPARLEPSAASNIVQDVYREVLGRPPDAGGWELHAGHLMNGKDAAWLRRVLAESPEGQARRAALDLKARRQFRTLLLHWILPPVWLLLLAALCRARIPYLIKKALLMTSALAGSLFAGYLILRYAQLPPRYPEFIVGHITWPAATKFQDLLVVPAALLVFFGIWLSGRKLAQFAASPPAPAALDREPVIIWYALPGAVTIIPAAIAQWFFNAPWHWDPLMLTISAVGLPIVIAAGISGKNTENPALGMLAAIMTFISMLILVNLIPSAGNLTGQISDWQLSMIQGTAMIICGAGAILLRSFSKILPGLLLGSQLLLPVFFVGALPQLRSGAVMPPGLIVLHTIGWTAALAAAGDLWRRWRMVARGQARVSSMISPWCLLAAILLARGGLNMAPPVVLPDDYHFGESLLGWWTWRDFGYLPYVDFIPSHGMADNYLPGMLNDWFFDGAPGAMLETGRLIAGCMLTALFFSIIYHTGHLAPAAAVTLLLGSRTMLVGSRPGNFLLAIGLFIFIAPRLRAYPRHWWFCWTIAAPLLFLALPGQGLLFLIATLSTGMIVLWRTMLQGRRRLAFQALLLPVVGWLLFIGLPPLRAMLAGALQYVLTNGPINQVAYGIPWQLPEPASIQDYLFEILRMGWVLLPAMSIWIIYRALRQTAQAAKHSTDKPHPGRMSGILRRLRYYAQSVALLKILETGLPLIMFPLLMIPYLMGRIDFGNTSRIGGFTNVSLLTGLPVLAWLLSSRRKRAVLIGCGAVWAATMVVPFCPGFTRLLRSPAQPAGALTDGTAHGLSRLGVAAIQPAHLQRLAAINQTLNQYLDPGEPYLDLTSRNAHYYYFERRPPAPVTAPYNMATGRQQREALARLRAQPPRVVLLSADNLNFDGPLSLRTHLLYRFIMQQYRPMETKGIIIGLPADLAGDYSEADLTLLDRIFDPGYLRRIPQAWGLSARTLAGAMTEVWRLEPAAAEARELAQVPGGRFRVTGTRPSWSFDLTGKHPSGMAAGLLRLDVQLPPRGDDYALEITWNAGDDIGITGRATAMIATGTAIVPLDAYPRWLAAKHLRKLEITIADLQMGDIIALRGIGLFQRNNVMHSGCEPGGQAAGRR